MNTTAANQADRQIELVSEDPLGNTQARWSTDDELLVWTVSRIEGGRRHGVERDCHVVYALSRGFFVEQTRKFRASAEQCIEMLQQGRRAGTIQRKIALDSIIALKSDPRSGRLQIRTLNGTHQIEPVSNEEADVLRQIGGELALRMPAGGASFSDYSGPSFTDRRRAQEAAASASDLAERERHALVAVENARSEDAPDAYEVPNYAGADDSQPVNPEQLDPEQLDPAQTAEDTTMSAHELQRIAAAVHAEMGPGSEVVPELPADITVVGGVDITFSPADDYTPTADLPAGDVEQHVATQAAEAEFIEPGYPEADYPEADYIAAEQVPSVLMATEDVESPYSAAAYQPGEYGAPDAPAVEAGSQYEQAAEYVAAEPMAEYPVEQAPPALFETLDAAESTGPQGLGEEAELAQDFDRRQQRAIRRQMDADSMHTDHSEPIDGADAPVPLFPDDPGLDLPAGAVFEPAEEIPSPIESAPLADEAHLHLAAPATPLAFSTESYENDTVEDRRTVDDPNFPSVFDRRGAHPVVPAERPGWARFDDDEDDVVEAAESDHQIEDQSTATSADPPTIMAPSGGQPIGNGGAVGFNPDFDVNPFR